MTATNFTLAVQSGTYTNVTIDWGCADPLHVDTVASGSNPGNFQHDYSQAACDIIGTESIDITITADAFPGLKMFNVAPLGDRNKLTEVVQWGNVGFTTFDGAFRDCSRRYTDYRCCR